MGKAMMGTGEGEGANRALEAAEQAIANPLLDGVSMQGAKGVIISIIGGDDMRLLEVDEAANHIRELVDPDANIIWGSAFNPDLQGKIRVSVVATGIDQSVAPAQDTGVRPLSFGLGRGPARPSAEPAPEPQPAFEPAPVAAAEPDVPEYSAPAMEAAPATADFDDPLELDLADEAPAPAAGSGQVADGPGSDDLLGGDFSAPEDGEGGGFLSGRRRGLVADDAGGGESAGSSGEEEAPRAPRLPSAGSTLFERMANLSRGGRASSDDDEDENADEETAISIPRFLGRQNNQ
jgi:cell division protein FtsZ